jgi:hypothetical protein
MKHMTILIYLLVILLIQIDQHQAIPIHLAYIRGIETYPPSLWYDTIDDIEDRQEERSIDRIYKRFVNDLLLLHRQLRFGNTKYGRSLLYD